jgi:hypothetical protein
LKRGQGKFMVTHIVLGLVFIDKEVTCLKNNKSMRVVKEKKPSLFVEYFKAVKNKVCPMINFIDED